MGRVAKAIILGGVIAGTLDISYAFIFYGVVYGISPLRILQSIASGLLGSASYSGGFTTGGLGLLLHMSIAVAAAFVFYSASRRFRWLVEHAIAAGIVFGLCMYGVMNFIVVPLSAFPHKQAFPPLVLTTGILVHMFLVGVPIALCVRAATASAGANGS